MKFEFCLCHHFDCPFVGCHIMTALQDSDASIASLLPPVICNLSIVNCHLSPVNSHLSPATYQLSTVNCQLSIVNCQLSTVTCYFTPLLPKPPAPLSVSDSTSTSSHCTVSCLAMTIWAIRSPCCISKGSVDRLIRMTLISPR